MLYSASPRGSAWPTRRIVRPLSLPLVKHWTSLFSTGWSPRWTRAESYSNLASASVIPHASIISSETLIVLCRGSSPGFSGGGSGGGGGCGTSTGATGGSGGGFGSELQARATSAQTKQKLR